MYHNHMKKLVLRVALIAIIMLCHVLCPQEGFADQRVMDLDSQQSVWWVRPQWLPESINAYENPYPYIYVRDQCLKNYKGPAKDEVCAWRSAIARHMYNLEPPDWTLLPGRWRTALYECRTEQKFMEQAIRDYTVSYIRDNVRETLKDVKLDLIPLSKQHKICDFVQFKLKVTYQFRGRSGTRYIVPSAVIWSVSPKEGLIPHPDLKGYGAPQASKEGVAMRFFADREGTYTVAVHMGRGFRADEIGWDESDGPPGLAVELAEKLHDATAKALVTISPPTVKEISIKPSETEVDAGGAFSFEDVVVTFKEPCVAPRHLKEIENALSWSAEKGIIFGVLYSAPEVKPSALKISCTSHPGLKIDLCDRAEFEADLQYKQEEDKVTVTYGGATGTAAVKIRPPEGAPGSSIAWPNGGPSIRLTDLGDYEIKAEHLSGISSNTLTLRVREKPDHPLLKIEDTSHISRIRVGQKVKLKAVELYCGPHGPDYRLTDRVQWKSKNPTVLECSHDGLVTGLRPGVASVELYHSPDENKRPVTSRLIEVFKEKALAEIRSINPLVSNMVELSFGGPREDGAFVGLAPSPMKIKAGQSVNMTLEFVVFGAPGEHFRVDIDPSIIVTTWWSGAASGEPAPSIPLNAITRTVRFGKNETQKSERAFLQFSIPYPTTQSNLHDLRLDIGIRGERSKSLVLQNAFEVEGPGTDFNGTGDLGICVLLSEADRKKREAELVRWYEEDAKYFVYDYRGDVKVALQPMGGQGITTQKVHAFGCPFRVQTKHGDPEVFPSEFPGIPLGHYRVIASVQGDEEFKGVRAGSTMVTLFKRNPRDRHAGSWIAHIELGKSKGEERPSFARPKPKDRGRRNGPEAWYIHVKVVDEKGRGITQAGVFTSNGAMVAREQGGGKYLLGPIKNVENVSSKSVDLVADISFESANFSPLGGRQFSYVQLKDKDHVYVTFKFDTSVDDGAGGAGAFGGGGGGTPSWVPKKPVGSGGQEGTGSRPAWAERSGGTSSGGGTGTGGSGDESTPTGGSVSGGGGGGIKRSRDECEKKFCPDCYFLGTRIDRSDLPAGGSDPCKECLSKNAALIKQCMEGK